MHDDFGLHILKVDTVSISKQIMRAFKWTMDENMTRFILQGLCYKCPMMKFNAFCQQLNGKCLCIIQHLYHFLLELPTNKALPHLLAFLGANLGRLEYHALIKDELQMPNKLPDNEHDHLVRLMDVVQKLFCTLQRQHDHKSDLAKKQASHVHDVHVSA